jgi:hypothetical protein
LDGLSEALLFAQEQLGGDELLFESACGLPVSAQIDRLERELHERIGDGFALYEVDLEQLLGAQREAAFDAIVAGEPSPFVLIGERLVCTGSVDVAAVISAIERDSSDKLSESHQ